VNERDRRGVNGPARKVARPASPSTLTAPRSAILLGGSCLRPLRGQSSLQLADAPVLFGGDLDQGRDEPPQLEPPPDPSESVVGYGRRSGGSTEAVVAEALRRIAGAESVNQLTYVPTKV